MTEKKVTRTKGMTIRREKFCREYIKHQNGDKAYKLAYNPDGMSQRSISREVQKLLSNPLIINRIKEMQQPALLKAQVSLERHLLDLERLRELAVEKGQIGAAVNAESLRGKACGLYIERKDVSGSLEITWSLDNDKQDSN